MIPLSYLRMVNQAALQHAKCLIEQRITTCLPVANHPIGCDIRTLLWMQSVPNLDA